MDLIIMGFCLLSVKVFIKRKMATRRLICLEEYEEEARSILDRNTWGYYSPGAIAEYTLRDNLQAFNRYSIFPRVLVDVSLIDMSVRLLGDTIDMPIGISPTAMQCLAHPDGEKATARAAARMGTCLTLSSWSTTSIEEVAEHNGSHSLRWFQLYVYEDNNLTIDLVRRAEREGFKALVVTVDTPESGMRFPEKRNKFYLPPHLKLANFSDRDSTSLLLSWGISLLFWDGIDWLRSITRLPIVLKGILRADDAREAMKHDIQGILVSNHGARQLDTVPAAIDALSGIVEAVKGSNIEVYLDSGIRHGTDVFKALALGARCVFIGRPVLWGLAVNGEEGVCEVLSILREEFRQAMVLSGTPNISSITKDLVMYRSHAKL